MGESARAGPEGIGVTGWAAWLGVEREPGVDEAVLRTGEGDGRGVAGAVCARQEEIRHTTIKMNQVFFIFKCVNLPKVL